MSAIFKTSPGSLFNLFLMFVRKHKVSEDPTHLYKRFWFLADCPIKTRFLHQTGSKENSAIGSTLGDRVAPVPGALRAPGTGNQRSRGLTHAWTSRITYICVRVFLLLGVPAYSFLRSIRRFFTA